MKLDESNIRLVAAVALLSVMFLSFSASAQNLTTYIALRPDSGPYCWDINFGGDGIGEYSLIVDDPGYPMKSWTDIHAANFRASETNIIIVPVCVYPEGRKYNEEAVISINIETPRRNVTRTYGICIKRNEDIDTYDSGVNPCEATVEHTDVFSASFLESELYAKPGQTINNTLAVSSNFMMNVLLEKATGPVMKIGKSRVYMPGEQLVDVEITLPSSEGEYQFSIIAKAEGCSAPSCEKVVEGTLHVSAGTEEKEGFRIELSPFNQDVHGIEAATYHLTIRNFDDTQEFDIEVETSNGLSTNFEPRALTIVKNGVRPLTIAVVPSSEDSILHTVKATVENEDGVKKTSDATLTVNEVVSDLEDEDDDETDRYINDYNKDDDNSDINDWANLNSGANSGAVTTNEQPEPEPEPFPVIWIIVIVIVVAVGVVGFYLYKKTSVESDSGSGYFDSMEGS